MKRIALVGAVAVLAAGCGSGGRHGSASTKPSLPHVTTTASVQTTTRQSVAKKQSVRAALRGAVRAALAANHSLAIRVLWTNRVPPTARESTRGPALAEMAASAKDRQKKGIRVRMIHDDYRILSIGVDVGKATATAVARWDQCVNPSHLDGTPIGRAVTLHERARIELRRADTSRRFVVWKVTLAS